MGLVKKIGKNERIRGLLCWLASLYIRLVWVTGRWTVIGDDIPKAYWDRGEPFILAFWHGRLLLMMKSWRRGTPIHMLISSHRDGQLIARTSAHFGIDSIAGSSTRGGAGAVRGMLKTLKAGSCVGITPDGPKGPRMRAQDGIVAVAKLSGAAIIPATYSCSPRRLLKSWDRFLVPSLFGRGVFIWGDPMQVPRDADAEQSEALRQEIERRMNALADQADAVMGVPPVQPAEGAP